MWHGESLALSASFSWASLWKCSGGRVLVEGKLLFLGGWLGFLDHL